MTKILATIKAHWYLKVLVSGVLLGIALFVMRWSAFDMTRRFGMSSMSAHITVFTLFVVGFFAAKYIDDHRA